MPTSRKFTFRLQELHALHANLRVVFLLMLLLSVTVLAYIVVRVFIVPQRISATEFASLVFFAAACVLLSVGQLQCLRRMRHDTREKLELLTFVDELTGVFNYRYLDQRLNEEFQRAKRHGYPVAVVYIDCDGFKMVNDTHGHETGNMVLRRTCEVLKANLRGEDFVGRLGGDEFLVVLPQTDGTGALIAAERLRSKLDALNLRAPSGQKLDFLGFSMGVASYPANGETREAVIKAADDAMYRAKRAGGGRVCL